MTLLEKPSATTTPVTAVDDAPVIHQHVAGFVPATQAPTVGKASALFLSLDAARAVGTPLYTLDADGKREYLPATFIGKVEELQIIQKDYAGSYEIQTKLVTRLAIGGSPYVLHVGLNSWAGQSLLTSLAQLTPEQLAQPLLLRMVPGRRTVFCRVSVGSDEQGWESIAVEQNFLSNRMETSELETLAASIDELL